METNGVIKAAKLDIDPHEDVGNQLWRLLLEMRRKQTLRQAPKRPS